MGGMRGYGIEGRGVEMPGFSSGSTEEVNETSVGLRTILRWIEEDPIAAEYYLRTDLVRHADRALACALDLLLRNPEVLSWLRERSTEDSFAYAVIHDLSRLNSHYPAVCAVFSADTVLIPVLSCTTQAVEDLEIPRSGGLRLLGSDNGSREHAVDRHMCGDNLYSNYNPDNVEPADYIALALGDGQIPGFTNEPFRATL